MLKKITIFLTVLVIISGAVGYFYYQKNIFGQDQLRFEITAPEDISVGKEVEYSVRYRNNSDVRLENFSLVFEYPEKSTPVEENNENIIKRGDFRREIKVGELNPGEEQVITFKMIPFGKKGDSLEASAWVSYIPKNLTSEYEMERNHKSSIDNVPIDFELQLPSNVDPNKEESFRLLFSSEMENPLTDIEINVEYPDGFYVVRSTPESDGEDDNFWRWPVLNEGGDGVIDIDGIFEGEAGDVKIIEASIGVWIDDSFITLKEVSRGTSISKSNILFNILINGKEDYIASPGEFVHYEIFFRNLGEETLRDLFLLVDLDKDTIDLEKVEAMNGKFQEDRDIIIWSHVFDSRLQSLREDEEGKVEFWVEIKKDLPTNPEVQMKASMEKAIKEVVSLVNTTVNFKQEVVLEGSPFDGDGPFPPEEGETSVFTVGWEVESLFNEIEDIKIKTGFDSSVEIVNEKLPEDAEISFNSINGNLEIEIEKLEPEEKAEVLLQIEMSPSGEVERDDKLIREAVLSATDNHTKESLVETFASVRVDHFMEDEEEEEDEEQQ